MINLWYRWSDWLGRITEQPSDNLVDAKAKVEAHLDAIVRLTGRKGKERMLRYHQDRLSDALTLFHAEQKAMEHPERLSVAVNAS